jgi:hypothetical protein
MALDASGGNRRDVALYDLSAFVPTTIRAMRTAMPSNEMSFRKGAS